MNKLKKIVRLVCLALLILLACMGAGFILPNNRGRFMNNEVKIELVEEKDDETDEMELKNIKQ